MPRSRNIKPGFLENEHLGELHSDIRLIFACLPMFADKEGIVEYRPKKLRQAIFGYNENVTLEMFHGYITVLTRLDNGSMTGRIQYENKEYLIIKNFALHQHPHHTEKKTGFPKIETLQAAVTAGNRDITVSSPLCNGYNPSDSGFLIPDSLIPDSIDNVHKKSERSFDLEFDTFWELFPKSGRGKGSKKKAANKFGIALKKTTFDKILTGVKNYAKYLKHTGQHNCDAFRWLENEQWNDDWTLPETSAPANRPKTEIELQNEQLGISDYELPRESETIDVTPAQMF